MTVPFVVVSARQVFEECRLEFGQFITVHITSGESEFVGQHRVRTTEFLQLILIPEDEQHAIVLPLAVHRRIAEQFSILDHRRVEDFLQNIACL